MVDASRKNDQVILLDIDADPFVPFAANIEVPIAVQNPADLFVFVQMFVEEHAHFLFVGVA